jgi:hypothetical protein
MENYIDFIGMYQDVFPEGFCSHLISEYERLETDGRCGNRQETEKINKTFKEDTFYNLNIKNSSVSLFNEIESTHIFLKGLQKCFDSYVDKFDILKGTNLDCTFLKMQKTVPGAGYHLWHFEQGSNHNASRCLVYSAYLNDIDDAGETEFLYQKLRIPPKENSVVIWPAAFTHTHRGNVVHGNKSKYIITGWFNLV